MMDMQNTNILKKYYNAHQISKSVNIIDIALSDYETAGNIIPLKCICNFLEPNDGWNRSVKNSTTDVEKCHYCMQQLSQAFPDYNAGEQATTPSANNYQCKRCYFYCCKKYVNDGAMRLNKKIIKIGKLK